MESWLLEILKTTFLRTKQGYDWLSLLRYTQLFGNFIFENAPQFLKFQ